MPKREIAISTAMEWGRNRLLGNPRSAGAVRIVEGFALAALEAPDFGSGVSAAQK